MAWDDHIPHTSYLWPSNGIFLGGWTVMIINNNQLYIVPLCVPGCWSSCKTGRCGEIHRWGHAGRRVLYDTKLGETATTQMAIVQSRKMIEEVTSGQTDSRVSGSFEGAQCTTHVFWCCLRLGYNCSKILGWLDDNDQSSCICCNMFPTCCNDFKQPLYSRKIIPKMFDQLYIAFSSRPSTFRNWCNIPKMVDQCWSKHIKTVTLCGILTF